MYAMSLLKAYLSASGIIEAKCNSGSSDPGVRLSLYNSESTIDKELKVCMCKHIKKAVAGKKVSVVK